ncbi:hypothetical protein ACROYT_G001528 [Oculina patagonica]
MYLKNQDTGQTWFKRSNSTWELTTKNSVTNNVGTKAGIGITVLAGLLIAAMVIAWRRHNKSKSLRDTDFFA